MSKIDKNNLVTDKEMSGFINGLFNKSENETEDFDMSMPVLSEGSSTIETATVSEVKSFITELFQK